MAYLSSQGNWRALTSQDTPPSAIHTVTKFCGLLWMGMCRRTHCRARVVYAHPDRLPPDAACTVDTVVRHGPQQE